MSQIIDTHTHFCTAADNPVSPEALLTAMEQAGISYALLSNLAGCELDSWHRTRPEAADQVTSNRATAEAVAARPDKFGGIFWIKPAETATASEAMELLQSNTDRFFAVKFHPYYSAIRVTDPCCTPWFELAQKLHLPVVVHTDWDDWSNPAYAALRAAEFPDLPIVMVHMGLWEGQEQALRLLREHPNLYGDLTWLRKKAVRQVLNEADPSRILFGSDALIAGPDSYRRGLAAIGEISALPEAAQHAILYSNAVRLFHLPATRDGNRT